MISKKINLNQLRILSVLLREPNLSKASNILGVSQPTLSSALKQLREEFDDPLLVRVGNRMELTTKASNLREPLDEIFDAVDRLWLTETAKPERTNRKIVIGTTDYGAAMISPVLHNLLRDRAPGISVQFIDTAETKELINRENELDFYLVPDAICHSPAFQEFKSFPLFEEEMVYVVGQKNPLAKCDVSEVANDPDVSFAFYHVGIENYSNTTGQVISDFERSRKIDLRIQQFSLLPMIAEETEAVVLMPRRLAEKLENKFDIVILGAMSPPLTFSFCLMWDLVHQKDRVHEFVRDLIKSEVAERS